MFSHRGDHIVPPLLRGFLLNGVLLLIALPPLSQAAFTSAITPDGTLGTTVAKAGNVYDINGGTIKGSNQFHSFGLFSVGTGDIASFNGPSSIANILSRVTGGQQSMIDGTLRTTILGANLYLLNPAGVLFGPNASLDLTGSFHVTTADYLRFTDGARFYADLAQPSVLSVPPVAAFGFLGPNPAAITIQESVLEVPTGKTLSLIGGDTAITGGPFGFISAPSGRVQIASVASPGEVVPTVSDLTVTGAIALGEITIRDDALLNTSGDPAGTVFIRGGRLTLNNSVIRSSAFGEADGGLIDIRVTGDLTLNNGRINAFSFDAGKASDIIVNAKNLTVSNGGRIETSAEFFGDAGSISVSTERLEVTSGGRIASSTSFAGDAGDLTVTATDSVLISGDFFTRLSTDAFFLFGNAGDISISTPFLEMSGGVISSETGLFSIGTAGNILLNVGRLELVGEALISSSSRGAGAGGGLTVNGTDSVILSDPFSSLQSIAQGTGNAGSITVSTPDLVIKDGALIQATTFAKGNAGDIFIDVGTLTLKDGGLINTDALFTFAGPSTGRGGNVTVTATDSVVISRQNSDPTAVTGITSTTFGSGAAGAVTISTPTLVSDDGRITAQTFGSGPAGSILVNVDRLTLTNGAQIGAETDFNSTGQGGNVTVLARESVLISGQSNAISGLRSSIDAGTFGTGDGGTVSVSAPVVNIAGGQILALTNGPGLGGNVMVSAGNRLQISGVSSGLFTSSGEGSGRAGDIQVSTGSLLLGDGAKISAKSLGTGNAGSILIQASDALVMRNSSITTQATEADGGDITVQVVSLLHLINSDITTSVGTGAGNGGNIGIDPQMFIVDHSRIIANAFGGNGGNIDMVAGVFLVDSSSVIDASSALGINGSVNIQAPVTNLSGTLAPLPQGFLQAAALLAQRCAARMGGTSSTFVVAGREGLPLEPGGLLPSPLYEAGAVGIAAAVPVREAPGAVGPVLERVLVAFHEPLRPAVLGRPRLVARALDRGCP